MEFQVEPCGVFRCDGVFSGCEVRFYDRDASGGCLGYDRFMYGIADGDSRGGVGGYDLLSCDLFEVASVICGGVLVFLFGDGFDVDDLSLCVLHEQVLVFMDSGFSVHLPFDEAASRFDGLDDGAILSMADDVRCAF